MNVGELCQRKLVRVTAEASLLEVASLMHQRHVGAVIVTRPESPDVVRGIITDRDITRAQMRHSKGLAALTVAAAMTPDPLLLAEEMSVRDAAARMRDRRVRRAPVVTAAGQRLVGLITCDDLLRHIAGELTALSLLVERQPAFEGKP